MLSTMVSTALLLAAPAIALPASSTPTGSAVSKVGNLFNVPNAGYFTHHDSFDFTSLSALPAGLGVSPDHIGMSGDAKYSQDYTKSNVKVSGGALQLVVPGGQAGPSIQGAEIVTTSKLLYGSIRTTAKIGAAEGVCSGRFSPQILSFQPHVQNMLILPHRLLFLQQPEQRRDRHRDPDRQHDPHPLHQPGSCRWKELHHRGPNAIRCHNRLPRVPH